MTELVTYSYLPLRASVQITAAKMRLTFANFGGAGFVKFGEKSKLTSNRRGQENRESPKGSKGSPKAEGVKAEGVKAEGVKGVKGVKAEGVSPKHGVSEGVSPKH